MEQPISTATSGQPQPPLRVLLVDDNPLFLKQVSRWLMNQPGILVIGRATSGEEGVEQANLLGPDLVLMDLSMPTMNGLQAAELIKSRLDATRVILISMHNLEPFRQKLIAQADGFVSKDELCDGLMPLIREIFPGRVNRGRTFKEQER